MAEVKILSNREEYVEFIDNYSGELRVSGRRIYEGALLVAVRV